MTLVGREAVEQAVASGAAQGRLATAAALAARGVRGVPGFRRFVVAQAHARAYSLLTGAILLAFLYAWLAMRYSWWLPRDEDGLWSLLRTTLLPLVVLPIALAEWSVPPMLGGPEEQS